MLMLVTAVSDVTKVAIAPVPDPVTFSIAIFVYVPALCVADSPVVLSNNALAVVFNAKTPTSSATNVNFKSAFLPMSLPEIVNTSLTAYPLP